MIPIKKLHPDALLPCKSHIADAGYDLFALEDSSLGYGDIIRIRTGISMSIPFGCVGIIKDRSSLANKGIHILAGVIDSGYTGEILVVATSLDRSRVLLHKIYKDDKIAQILIVQLAPFGNNLSPFYQVSELLSSSRGEGGFGSTNG